jgi:Replication-relaxation
MGQQLRVGERDIAMLESIATARYLTAHALEWLHFPGWEERYRAWLAKGPEAGGYGVSGRLYARLKRMREVDPPLVQRMVRPVALAVNRFERDLDAYCLGPGGLRVLWAAGRMGDEDVRAEPLRERSANMLPHQVAIGTVYAALRVALSQHGRRLALWRGDHVLARGNYDLVTVPGHRNSKRRDGLWPLLPDAACVVASGERRALAFVEVERERSVTSWREKVRAFEAYRGSVALKARYGVESFLVLVVAGSEAQRRRLVQVTGEELGKAVTEYRFGLLSDMHPLRITECWTRIGRVESGPRRVVQGRLRETWQVREEVYPLFRG